MTSNEQLIAEYTTAYFVANGKHLHSVRYEGGWFCVQDAPHSYVNKYRRKQIEAFRDELKRRVREQS